MGEIRVTVKDGVKAFVKEMERALPASAELAVLRAAQETAGILRREIFATFKGRTGNLARSYREVFLGRSGQVVTAGVVSDSVYADIQDRGGTITARSGRNLAIPFPGAKLAVGKWPRDFGAGELQFLRSRGGTKMLVRIKKRGGFEPVFILKPSVTLRGRGYLEAAATKAAPVVGELAGREVAMTVERATSKGA